MSQQNDYERVVVEDASGARREEIRTVPRAGGGNAGWWIAALVAVVAIVGLVFVFSNGQSSQTELQAARDTGRAEAMMDTASQQAQLAAANATQASRNAADQAAAASRSSADNAKAAAEQTAAATQAAAANAGDAAQDATDQITADTPPAQ